MATPSGLDIVFHTFGSHLGCWRLDQIEEPLTSIVVRGDQSLVTDEQLVDLGKAAHDAFAKREISDRGDVLILYPKSPDAPPKEDPFRVHWAAVTLGHCVSVGILTEEQAAAVGVEMVEANDGPAFAHERHDGWEAPTPGL